MSLPDAAGSRAVLIGVANYDHALAALDGARGNVHDLLALLTDGTTTSFLPESCHVVLDPTGTTAVTRPLTVAKRATDTLFVYYAGHGLVTVNGTLHLALSSTDPDPDFVEDTAIPISRLKALIANSPAKNRILILDCCYSGRAIEAMADPISLVTGQIEVAGTFTLTSAPASLTSRAPVGDRNRLH